MDLDLETGAILGEVGELTLADLSAITDQGSTKKPAITRLRSIHHAIARMLVSGLRPVEISASLGVSKMTIQLLENSPAFEELLAFYREKADGVAFDVEGKMQLAYADSLSRLHELIVDAENVDPDFLRRVTFDLADRVGFGPSKNIRVQSTHTTLSREDLLAIKERVRMKELSANAGESTNAAETAPRPEGMATGPGAADCGGPRMGAPLSNLPALRGPAPGGAGEREGV